MADPNIEAILEDGGDIAVGRVGAIGCVASAWEQEITIDEVNGGELC